MSKIEILEALKTMLTAPNKDAGVCQNDIYEEVRGNYLNFLASQFFPELKAGKKLKFVEKFIDEDRLILHDTFVELAFHELLKANLDLAGLKWDDPEVYEIFYKQVLLPADKDFVKVSIGDDKKLAGLTFVWPDHGPEEFLKRSTKDRFKSRLVNLPPVRFTVKVLTKIKTFIKSLVKAFKEIPGKTREFLAELFTSRVTTGHGNVGEVIFEAITDIAIGYGVGKLARIACDHFGIVVRGGFTPAAMVVMLAAMVITGLLTKAVSDLMINLQYYEYCKSEAVDYCWLRRKYLVFGDYVRRDKKTLGGLV